MIERFVAKVPSRIWSEGRPRQARQWEAEFNVASWVKLAGPVGEVALVVRYLDATEDKTVIVDCAHSDGDTSVLLSGQIMLRLSERVEQVQVSLRFSDAGMTHEVDELFMQRRGAAQNVADKLISNY